MNSFFRETSKRPGVRGVWPGCLFIVLVSATGCSMCAGPWDYDYPVFDTRYARTDPVCGRVGSVFSDPLVSTEGPVPVSNEDVNRAEGDPDPEVFEDDPDFRMDDPNIDPFEGVDPEDLDMPDGGASDTQTRSWLGGTRYNQG